MLSESLMNIDKNITFAQNLRNLLKTELDQLTTTPSISNKTKTLIKLKLSAIKLQTQKLRINIMQIRQSLPKTFQDFLPSQFLKYLGDQKKILRQVPFKQSYSNKENVRLGNIQSKKNNANQLKSKVQEKRKNQNRNQNLRNQIYRQLQQLKGLEKRENIVRSFNRSVTNRNESSIENTRPAIKQRRKIIQDNPIDRLFGKTILIESQSIYSSEDSRLSFSTLNADIPIVISKFTFDNKTNNNKQCSLYCPSRHQYYSGNVVNGIPNGNGRLVNCCLKMPMKISQNIEFYNGYFINGKFEGIGTLSLKNGTKFVGTFKQGERQGQGSLYYNGKVDVGRWVNDQLIQTI